MLVTEELLSTANALVNGLTKLQALEQAAATLRDDQSIIEQKVAANVNDQGTAIEAVSTALQNLVEVFALNPASESSVTTPAPGEVAVKGDTAPEATATVTAG